MILALLVTIATVAVPRAAVTLRKGNSEARGGRRGVTEGNAWRMARGQPMAVAVVGCPSRPGRAGRRRRAGARGRDADRHAPPARREPPVPRLRRAHGARGGGRG